MFTIPFFDLIEAAIKKGASELRLIVGRRPAIRLRGRLQALDAGVLKPGDTLALMKSLTPGRGRQELREAGSCDYGFAFSTPDRSFRARFRVAVSRKKGNLGIVLRRIPYQHHANP